MKLRKPRITADTKVRVVTDYKAGLSIQQILDRYHISQGTLYRILNEKIKKEVV